MENNITLIEIGKLVPHPDNPRGELGDLKDLVNSIKKNGVYQNLTVVPFGDKYRVVIGHRRLGAAKKAGLAELPCVISDMDEESQLATMLAENMQRSDLTLHEQVRGMNQMVMDFGTPVERVAELTGLSSSTVRRRVKLGEFNPFIFAKSQERQVTLSEYEKLFKIENVEERNKLLEQIGTKNFEYEYNNAIRRQRYAKNKARLSEQLDEFAILVNGISEIPNAVYIKAYSYDNSVDVERPADADKRRYYYYFTNYDYAYLYADAIDKADEKQEMTKEEKKAARIKEDKNRRVEALKAIAETAYECRKEFIRTVNLKEYSKEIMRFAIEGFVEDCGSFNMDEFCELAGVTYTEEEKEAAGDGRTDPDSELGRLVINRAFEKDPSRTLFVMAYFAIGDEAVWCWNWNEPVYDEDDAAILISLYGLLGQFGYVMSDEETQYACGTHELYIKEEE